MRNLRKLDPGYGQFRWVVLLLAVAVILPTVCLLWFMNEVVKNERLVVRQKLVTIYKNQLPTVARRVEEGFSGGCRTARQKTRGLDGYRQFRLAVADHHYEGLIVYGPDGAPLYPALSAGDSAITRPAERFADAWELEFAQARYEEAAQRYEQYARISDGRARLIARLAKSRCLRKLGRTDDAIAECREVAFSPLADTGDSSTLVFLANARLLLLNWTQGPPEYADLLAQTYRALLSMLYRSNQAGGALPADQNLFVARKALQIAEARPELAVCTREYFEDSLARLIAAEEQSLTFIEQFPVAETLEDWRAGTLQRIPSPANTVHYGIMHRDDSGSCVTLLSHEGAGSLLRDYIREFQDIYVEFRLLDDAGRLVLGRAEPANEAFATTSLGQYLPGWTIAVHFRGGNVFEQAASEQIAIYTWTGILVILLILLSGAVAAKSIGKQVRLNKLKNDFIATVTHELKTPLASMRVLVETLLEGNYRDQQQVTEYLQLVSKENERLSRLIDNFLTFSRMERNKQAFRMRPTEATAIARAAAEAVKTKLSRGNCVFETNIPEQVSEVNADPDALVTVLVNLLDNAYKYSDNEKRITLNVERQGRAVCFTVSDNGVGIPRRAGKRIFRRFYQVDRSLSRRAEGCGLGLSIAKFIVDAHAGAISVDSKPGQGSTFTVKLPVMARRRQGRSPA